METLETDMQLTEHFRLAEFTRSGTAIRLGIDNRPPDIVVECLRHLCQKVLEPLRRRFGVVRITSGYRCDTLNKAVGGAPRSQHRLGQAADIHITSKENGRKMFDYIERYLPFDQLLFEHSKTTGARWIHVSIRVDERLNRHQAIGNYEAP